VSNPSIWNSLLSRRACFAVTAMNSLDHPKYMRRAIELAANVPKYPFAAVLVDPAGTIVADVINECARKHPQIDWTKLTLYTTAEPCPMCQGSVAWAGIAAVVYGTSIPYLKSIGWWQIDIRAEEVRAKTPFRKSTLRGGVLEKECNALFVAAMGRK
jgi:tRNA(adenine34) deaminase